MLDNKNKQKSSSGISPLTSKIQRIDQDAKKILIVEDERSLRDVLVLNMKREGFDVLIAKNGQEGLDMALQENPDLILLDLVMPVMDGMEMLRRLRQNKNGKKIKVIILTNLIDTGKAEEAAQNEVYDYLCKVDWSMEDLIKKVRKILGIRL